MKVAAVQMDITLMQNAKNLANIAEHFEAAASAGAKLVVFPECALAGYCYTSHEEALPFAETVPGPSTQSLALRASKRDCSLIVGMLERDGDTIYNAAAVITPRGILGTHRKVHLLCLGIDRYDAPGDKPFPVFETPHAKVGINICYDCSFPESGRMAKLQGAQVLAIPTNWPVTSDTFQHTPPVRAVENHMHVIAADRVGEERGFKFAGHSQIVNFEGKVLAEAGATEETILYADLDIAAADRNRVVRVPDEYEFDRIAARRPEMYRLLTERR